MMRQPISIWEAAKRGIPGMNLRIRLFDGAIFLCSRISAATDEDGDVWVTLKNPQEGQCWNMDRGVSWITESVTDLETVVFHKQAIAGIQPVPVKKPEQWPTQPDPAPDASTHGPTP